MKVPTCRPTVWRRIRASRSAPDLGLGVLRVSGGAMRSDLEAWKKTAKPLSNAFFVELAGRHQHRYRFKIFWLR